MADVITPQNPFSPGNLNIRWKDIGDGTYAPFAAGLLFGWDSVGGAPVRLAASPAGVLSVAGASGGGGGGIVTQGARDGTAQAWLVDASATIQPVSGPLTDAQLRATPVPVSGTFFQATQPVSLVSVPTHAVTGTFWQATQPVSGTFWQATQPISVVSLPLPSGAATESTLGAISAKLPAALVSGRLDVNLGATITVPVSGTFWQATQPVSGTFWQATQPVSIAAAVDVSDRAARLLGVVYGSQAQQLKQTATNFNLQIENAVGGTLIDPRDTSDRAARLLGVVASITNALPVGANTIGAVTQGTAAVGQANAWYVRPRQVATYTLIFRLAARPYPLSNAFGAAGRKQYATIFHAVTATKTLKIREVQVLVRSISVAAIVTAELQRITSATTPATGNPAITAAKADTSDAALEATALALPTTAGTEAAESPAAMIQYETAAVTPATGSTFPPVVLPWQTLYLDPQEDEEKVPTLRAGVAEGFAVVFDCNAIATVTGLVKMRVSEE